MNKNKDLLCDEIAQVAYELYEKRGRAHGYHFDDWLKAERIVLARHAREVESVAKTVITTRKGKTSSELKPKARKTSPKASEKGAGSKKKGTVKKKTTE
jgi:hypothetical protein